MNFIEEIGKIFNTQTQEASIALAIIAGGSFLLGIFIFWLVSYLPLKFSSRRKIKVLSNDLEELQKTHTTISEEHKVFSLQVENLERELAEAQKTIADKTEENVTVSNNLEIANSKLYQAQKYQNNAQEEYGELKKLYNLAQMSVTESERVAEIAKNGQRHLEAQLEQIKTQYASFDEEKRQYTTQLIQLRAEVEEQKTLNMQLQQELNAFAQKVKEQDEILQEALPKAAQYESLQEELQRLNAEKSQVAAQLSTYTEKEDEERHMQEQEKNMMDTYLHLVQENMEDNIFFETASESLVEDEALLAKNLADLDSIVYEEDVFETLAIDTSLSNEELAQIQALEEQALEAIQMPGFYQAIDETALILPEDERDLEGERDEEALIEKMLNEVNVYLAQSPLFAEIPSEELIEDPVLLSQNLAKMEEQVSIETEENTILPLSEEEKYSMETALSFAKSALNAEGFYMDISREQLIDPQFTPRTAQANVYIDAKYTTEIEKNVILDLARINAQYSSDMPKDDLKQIDGIGTFIEQKLNHLSIYTFEQISKFDETFISKLTAAIGFAEDAIHRDNWVEQARELCQQLS